MEENQQITLDTYESGVQIYEQTTPNTVQGEFKLFLDTFLQYLKPNTVILEIGSAVGRDADYIESVGGFKVYRTDATQSFVEYLVQNQKEAVVLDVLHDTVTQTFDAVLAQAVFLHFTADQFSNGLLNVQKLLNEDGYFAISVKSGVGEEYSTHKFNQPRFFKYWSEADFINILEEHNFAIVELLHADNGKWLQAVTQRKTS